MKKEIGIKKAHRLGQQVGWWLGVVMLCTAVAAGFYNFLWLMGMSISLADHIYGRWIYALLVGSCGLGAIGAFDYSDYED